MVNPSSNLHHQSNLVTSMSSWLLVPRGRNFRHILGTVLCVLLVYHVTLLAMPIANISSSSSSNDNGALVDINTLCESCEDTSTSNSNKISQPQNQNRVINRDEDEVGGNIVRNSGVRTSASRGSQANVRTVRAHISHDENSKSLEPVYSSVSNSNNDSEDDEKESNFAPPQQPVMDTSGNNYNYYYTDEVINSDVSNGKPALEIGDSSISDSNKYDKSNSDNRKIINDGGLIKPHKSMGQKKPVNGKVHDKRNNNNKKLLNLQYQKRRKLLDSVFISVKSTKRFHKTRLGPVINTWFNLAKDQVSIIKHILIS